MAEFQEREKYIIQIVSYLNHPVLKQYPPEKKINAVDEILRAVNDNFKMSKNELMDLILGIDKEQEDCIKRAMNKLMRGN